MKAQFSAILLALFALACGISCSRAPAPADARPLVLTTLFPVTDFATQIAGPDARVEPLLPPGAEPHSYAPTPSDILRLHNASLLLYASPDLETWIPILADSCPRLVATPTCPCAEHEPHADAPADLDLDYDHSHSHTHARDPHTWLDPLQAAEMASRIADALASADPDHADAYAARADALRHDLLALHDEFSAALAPYVGATLLVGGHAAFGHLAARYRLVQRTPYAGFSPNAAPTPRALAELLQTVRDGHVRAIFYEDLLSPRLAAVLADEAHLDLLPLHTLGNVAPSDDPAPTYLSLMRENLRALVVGLVPPP